jgi:hypothetical protein
MSSNFDNAALTSKNLLEPSTVDEFHRNYLLTDAGLFSFLQVLGKLLRNRN